MRHSGDAVAASLPLAAPRSGAASQCAPAATTPGATQRAPALKPERGFFSLGVMERGAVAGGRDRDLTAAANQTSAAMVATAAGVVSMERPCNARRRRCRIWRDHQRVYRAAEWRPSVQRNGRPPQRNWLLANGAGLTTSAIGRGVGRRHRSPGRFAQAFDELGDCPGVSRSNRRTVCSIYARSRGRLLAGVVDCRGQTHAACAGAIPCSAHARNTRTG